MKTMGSILSAIHATIGLAPLMLLFVVLTTSVAEAQRWGQTIHVINRDGTEVRELLSDIDRRTHSPCFGAPCWSPDGEQIAFNVYFWGVTPGMAVDRAPNIMVVDAAGGEPRLLGDGSAPNWSPDGRHIAFTGQHTGIWLMNPEGRGREEFLGATTATPLFSPDGRGFLYVMTTENLYVGVLRETCYFDFSSGTSRRLDFTPALDVRGMTWSPDGNWIVGLITGRDRRLVFVSMAPENSRTVTVSLAGSLYNGTSYAWSPDGKTILCAMATEKRHRLQVHSFEVPDLDQPQVTVQPTWLEGQNPKRSNFQPAWSPDGEQIVFVSS